MQDGAAIPVGDLGLGAGVADAVDRGQQQVVGGGRSGARLGPEGFQKGKHTGLLSGQPEGAREAEIDGGCGQRNRGSAILDECGDALGGTEIRLVDDAGLTVDARAFDNVVVELVGFLLGDEGRHIG